MISLPNLRLWVGIVALVVALAGCGGGKIPVTNYYTLDLPAPVPAPSPLDHTAVVMPFQATRVIEQDRIVYRETREQVGFYEYHRWAEDPTDLIADSLVKELLAKGSFRSIVEFDGRTKADYILKGSIERLEEVDYDPGVSVAVEVKAELVNAETAEVVWSGSATQTSEVTQGEVRSVVSGMSSAAQRGVKELAGKIDSFLRSI